MRKSLRSSRLSEVEAGFCCCGVVVFELMLPLTVVTDVDDAGDDVTDVTSKRRSKA